MVGESMVCESDCPPRVASTSACVSPRVKSATPWGRGSARTSQAMRRMSRVPRPSIRVPRAARPDGLEAVEGDLLGAVGGHERVHDLLLDLGDRRVALLLLADPQRPRPARPPPPAPPP